VTEYEHEALLELQVTGETGSTWTETCPVSVTYPPQTTGET